MSQGKGSCVYCRADWLEPAGARLPLNDGYMNLGQLQPGMSLERDESTYNYSSWRRNNGDW